MSSAKGDSGSPLRANAVYVMALTIGLAASWISLEVLQGWPWLYDAHAYWAMRIDEPYARSSFGTLDAFLYSPAFAQAFSPLTHLPWRAFTALYAAAMLATVGWLARPVRGRWLIPFALFALPELVAGNIHIFLAAAIVLGMRYPAAWSFVILTKVLPGVGLVWFAVRREWRFLGAAVAIAVAIAGLSFLAAPHLWPEWIAVLRGSDPVPGVTAYQPPWWLRLPVALALVVWGARMNRPWTMPLAALISLPTFWTSSIALLLAIPRLEAEGRAPLAGTLSGPEETHSWKS
jgi:hypothetical protein